MKPLIATFAALTLALTINPVFAGDKDTDKDKDKKHHGGHQQPAGHSGATGGHSSSENAATNPEGTGGAVSDPGKSTSGGNAGNTGAASNPATGQAGKSQTNSGVPGTPSNP